MGTNYYAILPGTNPCSHCGRSDNAEELHIGKSSGGWCFSLHVIPDKNTNTLDDWRELLSNPGVKIRDEYGQPIHFDYLMATITERTWPHENKKDMQWYLQNHAEPGPNGLARHKRDNIHCVGNGEGTWDYITGEFC